MEKYKGFYADQYGTVYQVGETANYAVGKLNGDTLEEWVDDYLLGQDSDFYC